MNFLHNKRITVLACSLLICGIVTTFLPAFAGPGGIIKAAFNPWVILGTACLLVIGAPYFFWYAWKSGKHVERVLNDMELMSQVYPQYNFLDVRDRAMAVYTWVWSSWGQQKMSLASHHSSSWYWQNQQMLLDKWESQGLRNVVELKKIENVWPLAFEHSNNENGEGSRIVLGINAEVIDYMEEIASGKVVQGDNKADSLDTIWTFLWQDGMWKLNLIEPYEKEPFYLKMPRKLPKMVAELKEQRAGQLSS